MQFLRGLYTFQANMTLDEKRAESAEDTTAADIASMPITITGIGHK